MGLLPALPVRGHQDTTLNFEKLQREVGADWTIPESFSAKLEETTSVQVRREWFRTVARLKGLPKTKEEIPANTPLFTLPPGFRPPEREFLSGSDATARTVFVFRVETTGVVKSEGAMAAGHFFSFAGVTFNLT